MESKEVVKTDEAARVVDRRCEVGLRQCGQHGICEPLGNHRRDGQCHCETGYQWEVTVGGCVANITEISSVEGAHTTTPSLPSIFIAQNTSSTPLTPSPGKDTTSKPVVEKLLVNINNKTVELPEGSSIYEGKVTLSAYAIGSKSSPLTEQRVKPIKSL